MVRWFGDWFFAICATTIAMGVAAGSEPAGVRVELIERDVPGDRRWPTQFSEPTESYDEPAFAFTHIPWRYVETGVRADRANPLLLRASATVTLPAGRLRILLRGRNAMRLRIGDAVVAEIPFLKPSGDGHGKLKTEVLMLGVTRFVAPGDKEKLVEFDCPGGALPVDFELFVGGKDNKKFLRPELGETHAAWALAGSDDFQVLSPGTPLPLTDPAWNAYIAERGAYYDRVETEGRRAARAEHAPFWNARHAAAKAWAEQHLIPVPAKAAADLPAQNKVDTFLNARFARGRQAAQQASGTVSFYRDVRPILAERCFSCHSTQPQGGLRLDSLGAARRGGESGEPALVAGKPDESPLLQRVRATDEAEVMPPKGQRLKLEEIATLERWIREGAKWPDEEPADGVELAPLTDDHEFMRRVYLDVVGVPPSTAELRSFVQDRSPAKRAALIDRLLADPRWADVWTARWQDWLGESPNLVNSTLNNTGPFRWWLHESFRDNKPLDMMAWELATLAGSAHGGGPAGFGLAAQNDSPFVAKAGVLASTFLATEMKCARCHDAPFHASTQADLFHLAAMLAREPLKVPVTSSVPLDKLHAGGRKPLIQVTLKPGESLDPQWTLTKLVPATKSKLDSKDSRAQLAALLTAPENERFAEVLVNRVWHSYFGRGLVEPLNDWERAQPSHPELLRWLARQLVAHNYDLQYVARLILNSHAYQRRTSGDPAAHRFYAATQRRRLSAEQVLDSLFASFGVPLDVEPMCIDLDSGRPADLGLHLGQPRRAWEFAYLSNDRDRPSLNLPRAQAVTELLGAFGWPGMRQEAISDRRVEPNVLQPALLANGTVARWLTRMSDESALTELCLVDQPLDRLVSDVFLRILSREPTEAELSDFTTVLAPGYEARRATLEAAPPAERRYHPYVAWSNHLDPASNDQRVREQAEARRGPAATRRLTTDWRERMEDCLWTLLNSPELVYLP